MNISHNWYRYAGGPQSPGSIELLLERLHTELAGLVDYVALTSEDGIPFMEMSVNNRTLSFSQAIVLAQKAQALFNCPVHFHALQSQAISFFVFSEDVSRRPFRASQFEDYGTAVAQWLEAVQR